MDEKIADWEKRKTEIVTEASEKRYSASLTMGERISTPQDASASPFEASSMTGGDERGKVTSLRL